jgi:hypothetical protein
MTNRRLLLTATMLAGVVAGSLPAGTTFAAAADDCLANATVWVPYRDYTSNHAPWTTDHLAIEPAYPRYGLELSELPCTAAGDRFVTVRRPDGTHAHEVPLELAEDMGGIRAWVGIDNLDYYSGTGQWVASRVRAGQVSADLIHPVAFTIKRRTVATLSVKPTPAPYRPVARGTVLAWNSAGHLVASVGRKVYVRTTWGPGGTLLATATTDQYGRYAVRLPVTAPTVVHTEVPSTSTRGWFLGTGVETYMYHPTSITGTAGPTTDTVIRNGTKMSTYGHLSVTRTDGTVAPYANQTVLVQTRPKSDPSQPYKTVSTATSGGTGYYYANWTATVDADVRVAFLSPYKTVKSSYRWIRAIDVT